MIKGCCQEPGKTCFTKVGDYGQCRKKCPKGWNCTKVTEARPYLALPCNKEFKQCGGGDFKGNPCCEDGLVCHGDEPQYFMQCTNKDDVEKKKSDTDSDDDDDDGGVTRLSALPTGLNRKQEPHAKFPGFYVLGIAFMATTGAAALAARKQACQGRPSHHASCTEDGVQEEPLQPTGLEG